MPVYDFLLVINSNLGPISYRYWDTVTYWPKITNFAHPLSFSALVSGWPLSNLWKSFTVPETRVFRAADGEDLVILTCAHFAHPLSFSTLVRGDPLRTYGKTLRFLKLESSMHPTVKIWWSYLAPFLTDSPAWQTYRWTDGRTDRQMVRIAMAMMHWKQ